MVRSWFPRLFNLRKPIKMALLLSDRLRQEKSANRDRENANIFAKEKVIYQKEHQFVTVKNVDRER